MLRKILLIVVGVVLVGAVGLFLAVRSILGSDGVRVAIERQATEALGQPVRVGSATVSLLPRVSVDLGAVSIGEPSALTLQRVSVTTGLKALLSRRVEGATIVVADSRLTLPLPFRVGTAPGAAGTATPTQPGSAGASALTISSVDTISFRNLQLAVRDKVLTIDLESSLTGDRLDIHRVRATSDMTTLEASGVLTSLSRRQGTLDIRGNPLDLDELMAILSGIAATGEPAQDRPRDVPAAGEIRANPIDIRVTLAAPKGRVSGYDFADLVATLEIASTRLSLAPVGLGMFGGRYDGTALIEFTGGPPSLALDGTIAGVNMAAVVATAGSPDAMTGTLGGSLSLKGRGADSASMLKAAQGRAGLAITDGTIPGLEMVRTVVLAFGKPTGAPPEGSGSAFTRLGGTFALAQGVLSSSDIAFTSRDFDMRGEGTVSLSTGALNVEADVVLSRELSGQAGADLVKYTQEQGRVVLPGKITGTIAQPRVFIDIGEAMGRAMTNEMKRGVESLLKGLLKKP